MVIRNFEDTWEQIETLLKANALMFGIDANAISSGEPDEAIAPNPPFIKIFAMPDIDNEIPAYTAEFEILRFTFFIAGTPADSLRHSIQNAVRLSLRVRKVLMRSNQGFILVNESKIAPQAVFSNYSLMSFDLTIPYNTEEIE